ncbi:guanine nucleotide-binding protein G(I)/G(S)/G(O) subunit gamma-11-like [Mytilus galloprovincialis]|uniref:guanine nucleotide-binding protein G(I)/G(S)/G(O) subunit gamma-11-like n=1 Tax=Mytilus galloprovincialis TaxID=29158 RepID=UPI003F7C5247
MAALQNQIEILKEEVQQLSHEVGVPRGKVSDSIEEIRSYIKENEEDDPFLQPNKDNPFSEKGACIIL